MALHIAETGTGRRMSFEEWGDMPEDEEGELVDGVLVEEGVPIVLHELVVAWLVETLRSWIAPRGGLALGSGLKFVVTPTRGRKPDVTLYLPGTKVPLREGVIRVPPYIAGEILSVTPRDARRDRIQKADEYARFGVRWYWLLDPEQRTLEILELGSDGRYVRALGATEGVIESVPGCSGLVLDLDGLWPEIERADSGES
jgi:Uma2 family endonuclease